MTHLLAWSLVFSQSENIAYNVPNYNLTYRNRGNIATLHNLNDSIHQAFGSSDQIICRFDLKQDNKNNHSS